MQACSNKELRQIELKAELTGYFVVDPQPDSAVAAQDTAILLTNTYQNKLDLSGVSNGEIDQISPNLALVGLNKPADSTFSFFENLTLSLENGTDSIAIAEIGEFTTLSSDVVSLRLLNGNVKPILEANEAFWLEMNYTINPADTFPEGIDMDVFIEWLVAGEL
ncbi:MAG: hypothetical protein ACPGJS_08260 [Flammeovirgaceae bacterium]